MKLDKGNYCSATKGTQDECGNYGDINSKIYEKLYENQSKAKLKQKTERIQQIMIKNIITIMKNGNYLEKNV